MATAPLECRRLYGFCALISAVDMVPHAALLLPFSATPPPSVGGPAFSGSALQPSVIAEKLDRPLKESMEWSWEGEGDRQAAATEAHRSTDPL